VTAQQRQEFFVVTAPGLERLAAGELRELGLADVREVQGGAGFRGTLIDAMRANLWLRTGSRVLLRLGQFDAPGRRELGARLKRLNLEGLLAGELAHVSVACQQSRLYHTGLVTDVVRESLGVRAPAADQPAPMLFVRLVKDRCTVSLDTSGELLHRRGYRRDVSRAPLRETLAAALLMLAGYDGRRPLLDPMCGSGTIAIEAALLAAGRAPGARRPFALEAFPSLDRALAEAVRSEAAAAGDDAHVGPIWASDIHGGALQAARSNAARAGVERLVQFERADVSRRPAPTAEGLLLTNPPYGRRLPRGGGREGAAQQRAPDGLALLARGLAGALRDWDRFVIGPGVELRQTLRLPVVRAVRLENGGLPVELVQLRPTPTDPSTAPAATENIPTPEHPGQ